MSTTHDCTHGLRALEARAFDYRRGDLSEVDAALFEEELAACPRCAQKVQDLIGVLDAATDAKDDAAAWLPQIDDPNFADDLFANIAAAIHEDTAEDADDEPPPEAERDDPGGARVFVIPRWSGWVAAAAAILLLIAAYALGTFFTQGDDPAPDAPANLVVPLAEQHLERAPATPAAVTVYATADAVWRLSPAAPYTLDLERGAVLVDFLPTGGERLAARVDGIEVDVIGTVFYLVADGATPQIGVLTGAVRVTTPGGEAPVTLKDRESLDAGAATRKRPISPHLLERLEPVVNIARHKSLLAKIDKENQAEAAKDEVEPAKDEAKPPSPIQPDEVTPTHEPKGDAQAPKGPAFNATRVPSDTPNPKAKPRTSAPRNEPVAAAKEPEPKELQAPPTHKDAPPTDEAKEAPLPEPPLSVDTLRLKARDALRARDHKEAAVLYERALAMTPQTSPAAASLRLELARIYAQHLGRPDRATHHLERFLGAHPGDVAAPSARQKLCRLLGDKAKGHRECGEGR